MTGPGNGSPPRRCRRRGRAIRYRDRYLRVGRPWKHTGIDRFGRGAAGRRGGNSSKSYFVAT
jgi:hypothetical protein